jgi:hypothetical protein
LALAMIENNHGKEVSRTVARKPGLPSAVFSAARARAEIGPDQKTIDYANANLRTRNLT